MMKTTPAEEGVLLNSDFAYHVVRGKFQFISLVYFLTEIENKRFALIYTSKLRKMSNLDTIHSKNTVEKVATSIQPILFI